MGPANEFSVAWVDRVPLLDVTRENQALSEEIGRAIDQVCRSGRFILGPECESFEEAFASRFGIRHALGCASGSDALLLALQALDIGAGDEVIVPSFTFFASASCIWRIGAVPVFADIDPRTLNVSPLDVQQRITSRTRAIVAVHLFGQPADMEALGRIAERHRLKLIEDAAQSIGARFEGRYVGGIGDIGCFSFYPTKNLGGFGDGGMLTTNDDALAQRLRVLRVHGMRQRYVHDEVGINSRLDTLQAAVLMVKLGCLQEWTDRRAIHAARYGRLLAAGRHTSRAVGLPVPDARVEHVWNQYTIRVSNGDRDRLRSYLMERGVGTEVYYPIPLHRQPSFRSLGVSQGPLPETERAACEVLSLPVFPTMTQAEQETVIGHVEGYFRRQASPSPDHLAPPTPPAPAKV